MTIAIELPLWSDTYISAQEWAEKNVILPSETPKPGILKLNEWQKGVLDAYNNSDCRQITLQCSSQIGKSLLMLLILGYHIGVQPRQILFFNPNLFTLKRFIREKLDPLVAQNPELEGRVSRTHQGNFPMDLVRYIGGQIFFGYSGSPASYRSVSAELVVADEIDVYASVSADSSNPLTMLKQRGEAYGRNAKLVVASTPIDADISLIGEQYELGTASEFHVPCPHCGVYHALRWENVLAHKNDEGQTDFAVIICPECKEGIENEQRLRIVEQGKWIHTNPNPEEGHYSFHVNQFYSTFSNTTETARKADKGDMRGFTTQVLGIPYKSDILEGDPEDFVEEIFTREPWSTDTKDITAITASVDVQGNRLEYQIVHWFGNLAFILCHRTVERKVERAPMWKELNRELKKHNPDMIFIDRGWKPDEVRKEASLHLRTFARSKKLKLIKGSSTVYFEGGNDLLIHKRSPKDRPLYLRLNVDEGKLLVADYIIEGKMRVNPDDVPADFSEQLTAEKLRMITVGTRERPKWVKVRPRNEALDCFVYNICAKDYLGDKFRRSKRIGTAKLIDAQKEIHTGTTA